MGESEARTEGTGWSADPASASDPHAADRKKRELEALTLRVFGDTREVWPGKGYELARKVRDELITAGKQADGPELTAAFEHASQHYVQKNGKRFTPKVLREGLRQWEAWNKGKHSRQNY